MKVGVAKESAPGNPGGRRAGHGAAARGSRRRDDRRAGRRRGRDLRRLRLRGGRRAHRLGGRALREADVVCKVRKPSPEEVERLREGQALVALLQPLVDPELVQTLAGRGVTAFSMDVIPRVTRAQPMDALSSQSTISGYKAAILAAEHLGKFFPMLTTAAGTIPPAKVLVLGAGVASLQAIATARRLGAVVSAFDVRPVVKEQVESLGATFLELDVEGAEGVGGYAVALAEDQHEREQELIARHAAESDAVITTALVPGRPAPELITEERPCAACDRLRDRRPRRRGRRQLRRSAGRDDRRRRRDRRRPHEPARDDARPRARCTRATSRPSSGSSSRTAAGARLRGRDRARDVRRARRQATQEPRVSQTLLEQHHRLRARRLPRHRADLARAALLHTPLMSRDERDPRHRPRRRDADRRLGRLDLEQALAFVAVVFATINVVGGFLVTDRMLEMFKRKPARRRVTLASPRRRSTSPTSWRASA